MARTNIPVTVAVADLAAGIDLMAIDVAADDANEMMYDNQGGNVFLIVLSPAASGVSVEIIAQPDPYNRTATLGPTAVGASKTHVFGPFTPLLFSLKQGVDVDKVHIDISSISGSPTLAAVKVPVR